MLPRISSALSELIKPIKLSLHAKTKGSEKGEIQSFERFQSPNHGSGKNPEKKQDQNPENEKEPSAPTNVIPFPTPSPEAEPKLHVAQAFVQLVNLMSSQRQVFSRWLGTQAYRPDAKGGTSCAAQKTNGKLRKGAMLDRTAE